MYEVEEKIYFSSGSNSDAWTTEDELVAIEYMGTNKYRNKEKHLTVAELKERLRAYIISCYSRHYWAYMNKAKCEKYAQELLARL